MGVQLYGPDPDTLAEAARWVEEHVPCELIDLNMGCPVPKVVSRGAGAALMRDPQRVERLVRRVSDAVSLPVTAKTRCSLLVAVYRDATSSARAQVSSRHHARGRARR